ncbi:SGL-domain-containing protein [Hyaloscypha variabilis F]|uniref:SGL-domain-containing protein n=1 Tax=Hyaloscypha variabilis (strain UAMH 11265 / GT02V1 / F) TaxID=1149755 RepID=A0A2J6RYA3_HYAVF|nr:SGL-domain-containing protein [Hyaloscypha variabilis F]
MFLSWWKWLLSFFYPQAPTLLLPSPKMTGIKQWVVKEPWLDIRCELGEGPYYEPATHSLRFVDIKKKQLHTVSIAQGPKSLKTLQLDMPIGVTADIEGVNSQEKILIAGKSGIYILERKTGNVELLKRFYDTEEKDERLRSNDGAVDPQGRFWVGTMNDFWLGDVYPEGSLFRFSSDLTRTTLKTGLKIPNSIGWSPDHKTLYFVRTTSNKILAYDFSPSGSISNERVFYTHPGPGSPDGFRIDEEGYVWQAIYGEGRVIRIDGQGNVVAEVKYPTRAITCPVFVGTELWVTTAGEEDEKEVESKRYGGAVFKVDVGVRGAREFEFKLERGA